MSTCYLDFVSSDYNIILIAVMLTNLVVMMMMMFEKGMTMV